MRRAFGEIDIDGAHVGLRAEAVGDQTAILDAADHRLHFGMIETHHGEAVERHMLDEALERVAHALEGAVVVEMIGIDIGDDGDGCRQAQEGAVAFVGFHDHPFAGAEARIGAVGVDDAAIDDGGIEAARIQQGSDQSRRRRLAVGAGDSDAILQMHDLGQHLGAAHQRQFPGARRIEFGVAGFDGRGIDDDDRVAEIVRRMADDNGNALRAQTLHIGAVDRIGAAHAVAEIVHDLGDAAHADAADADEMDRADVEGNARAQLRAIMRLRSGR